MNDGPMQGFFVSLWERRGDSAALRGDSRVLEAIHLLARAVVAEIEHHPAYDPEIDHRVLWAREVLNCARSNPHPGRAPRASADLEAMAQFLLHKGPFAPGAALDAGDADDPEVMFPR